MKPDEKISPAGIMTKLSAVIFTLGLSACEPKPEIGIAAVPAEQMAPAANTADNTSTAGAGTAESNGARADRELATAVKSALVSDPTLMNVPIDVAAYGGIVTLHGTVSSAEFRTRAMQIAHNVPGVKLVNSKLELTSGS